MAKFVADVMLGRLARFMRFAGYDVEYDSSADDDSLLQKSRSRGTVLLTRDRQLAARCKPGKVYFVETTGAEHQLAEVEQKYPPVPGAVSRCLVCNTKIRRIARAKVAHLVPPFVFSSRREFYCCSGCHRIYWKGTHFERMSRVMK